MKNLGMLKVIGLVVGLTTAVSSMASSGRSDAVNIQFPKIVGQVYNQTSLEITAFKILVEYDCVRSSRKASGASTDNKCERQTRSYSIDQSGRFVVPSDVISAALPDGDYYGPTESFQRILLESSEHKMAFLEHRGAVDGKLINGDDALNDLHIKLYETPEMDIPFLIPNDLDFNSWLKSNHIEKITAAISAKLSQSYWNQSQGFLTTHIPRDFCGVQEKWSLKNISGSVVLHLSRTACVSTMRRPNDSEPRLSMAFFYGQTSDRQGAIPEWISREIYPAEVKCEQARPNQGVCQLPLSLISQGAWSLPPIQLVNEDVVLKELNSK